MKKTIVSLLAAVIAFTAFSDPKDGITFRVEELSKPEKPLNMTSDIWKNLIEAEAGVNIGTKDRSNDSLGIIATSEAPDLLVKGGMRSFFNGMYQAYADHRPFVLSPDMIWLLICQGFAQHVNADPEALRHHFVDFAGRRSLMVLSDELPLTASAEEWETIFPKFTSQISKNTKGDLIDILSADFSTTTGVEKVASQVTIMKAMENYFEFIVVYIACGIPEITLRGTTEDWQKILDKTKQLARYDLQWWVDELVPLLEEFVRTSEGKVDKQFWQAMFKYHDPKKAYTIGTTDGWILKFFPYDKDGKRTNMVSFSGLGNLPDEIVKVDLKYMELRPDGSSSETPLELWAGFIGLAQDTVSYALTPQIGWMIRKKDARDNLLKKEFEREQFSSYGVSIMVKEIPAALLELDRFLKLKINFTDSIVIPDKMKGMKIGYLSLTGKITEQGIERIKSMFPETRLVVNNVVIIEKEMERRPDLNKDLRFRAVADSILAANLPGDYAKADRLQRSFGSIDYSKEYPDGYKRARFVYLGQNKDGYELRLIKDDELYRECVISLDAAYKPIEVENIDMLKRMYEVYDRKVISAKEALEVFRKYMTINENRAKFIHLIYDIDKDIMIWRVSGNEFNHAKGDVKEIRINAQTGEVIDIKRYDDVAN